MWRHIIGIIVLACVLSARRAAAGDTPVLETPVTPAPASPPKQRAIAGRCTGAIKIDGKLDEADWRDAARQSGFWQRHPNEAQPPEHDTQFSVLYDDDALFVAIRANDAQP